GALASTFAVRQRAARRPAATPGRTAPDRRTPRAGSPARAGRDRVEPHVRPARDLLPEPSADRGLVANAANRLRGLDLDRSPAGVERDSVRLPGGVAGAGRASRVLRRRLDAPAGADQPRDPP